MGKPLAIGAASMGLSLGGAGQGFLASSRCIKELQRYQTGMLAGLKDCFRFRP